MVGTSGAMRLLYEGEPPAQLPPELWCYRADRRRVLVGGALSDGGGLYGWMRETLLAADTSESIESSLEVLEPDEHGLTVLPFWSGERSRVGLRLLGAFGPHYEEQPIDIARGHGARRIALP